MPRLILLSAATALAVSLPAHADTKTYTVGNFSDLDVSAGVTVYFEAGETQYIEAENENGNFDRLIIEQSGDTLKVSRKSNRSGWFRRNRQNYTVRITAPAISSLDASSGSSVSVQGMSGSQIKISTSSGANADVTGIEGANIDLSASSGSRLEASGACGTGDISTSSGAGIYAADLECAVIDAGASSGSSIRAYASEKVDGRASSGANVRIKGGAEIVDKSQSSGGSVRVS